MARSARLLLSVCLLSLLSPIQLRAQSHFDLIPADAKVVVAVQDLKALESRVKEFAESIGVPSPPIGLEAMLDQFGLGGVLALEKGLALVVMEPGEDGLAILLSVYDAKAALPKLGGKAGENEPQQIDFPPNEKSFVIAKGNTLIFAQNADRLKAFQSPARNLGALAAKAKGSDLFVHVNVLAWRPLAEQGLQMAEGLIAMFPGQEGIDPETIAAMFKMYLDGARLFLKETDAIQASLKLTKAKAEIRADSAFAKGSYLAEHLGSLKRDDDPLKGVPAGQYAFAGGVASKGLMVSFRDVMTSMMSNPAVLKSLPADKAASAKASMAKMYEHMTGFSFVLAPGEPGMAMYGAYLGDPKQLRDDIQGAREGFTAMMGMMPGISGKWETKKVGAIEVDQLSYDFSKLPAEQRQALAMFYGPEMKMQLGVVDGLYRFAMGNGDPIAKVSKGTKSLADDAQVRAALADLPKDAPVVILVDLFGYGKMIMTMMKSTPVGAAIPNVQFPEPPPPPIGVAITGQNGTLSKHIVIRADTIKAVVDTVKNAMGER